MAIVGQAVCRLATKGNTVDTLLQMQENVDLLLGMDILRQLGFTLSQAGQGDLLAKQLESERDTEGKPHPNQRQAEDSGGGPLALDRVGTAGRIPTEQLSSSFKPLVCQLDMSRLLEWD